MLGSSRINSELSKRFEHQTTSLDEKISVVHLDKSNGVVEVDEAWLQQTSNAAIKEYFFGHAGHALSPSTLQVDFDTLAIYKPPECERLQPPLPPSISLTKHRFPTFSRRRATSPR